VNITPTPTDEEMAAIAAAVQVLVLRPVVVAAPVDDDASQSPAWRFSGRWWSRPIPSRRIRP
jgi:hypothetical protein